MGWKEMQKVKQMGCEEVDMSENKAQMNIAVAFNQKFFKYAYVMMTSLYENNKDSSITLYVLHSELTEEMLGELLQLAEKYSGEIVPILVEKEKLEEQLPTTTEWSIEMYYRLLMPDLLPEEIERILYLDVDMIINQNLHDFYAQDFEGKLFCVCKDVTELKYELWQQMFGAFLEKGFAYFNSGVMLWNLKEVRKKYHFADYMRVAKQWNYQLVAPDQDLLNYCHWQEVKYADAAVYNQFARVAHNQGKNREEIEKQVVILHFAGAKPWGADNVHFDIEKIWWEYAKRTPYYAALCEEFILRTMTDTTVEQLVQELMENIDTLQQNLNDSLQLNQQLLAMISSNSTS